MKPSVCEVVMARRGERFKLKNALKGATDHARLFSGRHPGLVLKVALGRGGWPRAEARIHVLGIPACQNIIDAQAEEGRRFRTLMCFVGGQEVDKRGHPG